MIFGAVPVADALGAVLAHSVAVGTVRLAKGTVLAASDIAAARKAGHARLVVARAEPGDIAEDAAAAALAARLAGNGIFADPPSHGRVNLRSLAAGLFCTVPAQVHAVNRIDEAVTLGVLPPMTPVRGGEIVATVKIIPYFVAGATLSAAEAAAAPLSIAAYHPLGVRLVQTTLGGTPAKLLEKTARITKARIEVLGGRWLGETRVAHDAAALAAAIMADDAELLLVAGASATSDRRDVVPAAITAAGGAIVRLGMPVDPGNLLLVGALRGRPVIGLPGCARSPKRNGFDFVLERLFAGLGVDSSAIAEMGVGGLLADVERPDPRGANAERDVGKVGVILLAAGRAQRMGSNKLLEPLGDRPLIAHTLAAIADAELPLLVVTGHAADQLRPALPAGTQTVHAADHAAGIGRSIAAGIAAVPVDWDAAIIMLADMPLVEASLLRALTDAAQSRADIVVPAHDGRRGNPVLWGRDHFAALASLDGDIGGKPLLADRAALVRTVAAPSDAIFMDADTPAALAAIRAAFAARGG
jgi:molybdenum cofactor cytidylyltransferase